MAKPENILAAVTLCAVAAVSAWMVLNSRGQPEKGVVALPASAPVEQEQEPAAIPAYTHYPSGKLVLSPEREQYGGGLWLEIPRLDFEGEVLAAPVRLDNLSQEGGVPDSLLERGVGLFGLSQLPGGNANVSIAGHRDVHGMEFYHIDRMEEGDEIILTWEGKTYRYRCEEILVTDPSDWDPVRVREYGSVTLQSCTPVGVASHRIFVTGRLVEEGEKEPGTLLLEEGDLSLEAEPMGEELRLTLRNRSPHRFAAGTGYEIHRLEEAGWAAVLQVGDHDDIRLDLPPEADRAWSLPLHAGQMDYPSGSYRAVVTVEAAGEPLALSAEFILP